LTTKIKKTLKILIAHKSVKKTIQSSGNKFHSSELFFLILYGLSTATYFQPILSVLPATPHHNSVASPSQEQLQVLMECGLELDLNLHCCCVIDNASRLILSKYLPVALKK